MSSNRRQHRRIPTDNIPCVVSVDSVHMEGIVVDESAVGIGIAGLDLMMMPFNKPVVVELKEGGFSANARHVGREDDGRFNLGLVRRTQLTADEAAQHSAMLINCYVKNADAMVICMPIEVEADGHVLVQLWDGTQFRIRKTDLISLSRIERFSMLENEVHTKFAMDMYGFRPSSTESDRRRVFEHEFGHFDNCPVTAKINENLLHAV